MNIDQDSIGIALGHALNRHDDIDRYTAHHPVLFARGIEGAHFSQAFVIIAPKMFARPDNIISEIKGWLAHQPTGQGAGFGAGKVGIGQDDWGKMRR